MSGFFHHKCGFREAGERGSVVIWLFIVIALFASLSFTVANMMRDGNPEMISEQKAQIIADEILQYGQSARNAVMNMKISNGCSDTAISFEAPGLTGYGHTPAAADGCRIFSAGGGGVSYLEPHSSWLNSAFAAAPLYGEWYATGSTCVEDVPSDDTNCRTDGVDNEDLVMFLHAVQRNVCVEINDKAGITNTGGEPPVASACHAGGAKFTGTYSGGGYEVGGAALRGRPFGCFRQTTMGCQPNGAYIFYQVLNAR